MLRDLRVTRARRGPPFEVARSSYRAHSSRAKDSARRGEAQMMFHAGSFRPLHLPRSKGGPNGITGKRFIPRPARAKGGARPHGGESHGVHPRPVPVAGAISRRKSAATESPASRARYGRAARKAFTHVPCGWPELYLVGNPRRPNHPRPARARSGAPGTGNRHWVEGRRYSGGARRGLFAPRPRVTGARRRRDRSPGEASAPSPIPEMIRGLPRLDGACH